MIAFVKGKLAHKDPTHVIIDVNGIGYYIHISLNTFSQIKDQEACQLHTYLHVREDAQTLFGFGEIEEKTLFLHLISVSGIGPSTGLVMLSSLSANEITSAIINEDVPVIQSVKGIGSKTAQRAILELKDKLRKEGFEPSDSKLSVSSSNTIKQEALSALLTLGINKNVAQKSIESILNKSEGSINLETLIKKALQNS
ncbi:MAG: Holliday junction branch migration protein RuvA [Cyclobacteriaceae bacterium]|nr:Holliday junction branch migration protein RuvA [Cyclobacteriaceae bacterium]